MTATDWVVLEFLSAHPQPVRGLIGIYPKATVYARLHALQEKGLVAKKGTQYLLTSAGLQVKAEHDGGPVLDGLDKVYPPLREVPSRPHRAMVELIISALVVRQHTDQDEHHAGFLFVGPPMSWKTAGGRFVSLIAGADPNTCVVDLGAEAGRSLWIRRGAAGDIRSQRALLNAPVIVLDEYGLADRAVRQSAAPFISGRRRVPYENDILSITPVPVITMNPRPGNTLSARTSFSPAQLRRLVACDVSAVPLPHLALEGGRALEAARQAGPLPLRPPRGSCEDFRSSVVRLLRQVLVPDAVGLVDVELVIGLGRGLTGWLTPLVAMRQVLFDLLLSLETVSWVRPRWLEAVRAFPDRGDGAAIAALARLGADTPSPVSPRLPETIQLFPERSAPIEQKEHPGMNSREAIMPAFSISEHSKGLLVWMATDARASLDQVVQTLVGIYRMQRFDDITFRDLLAVVRLRETCETAEISVSDLATAVDLTAGLGERGLTLDHIHTVLQVAEDLAEAGFSLKEAVGVADLMKALKKSGVDPRVPERLEIALQRYEALGYEPNPITRLAEFSERLRGLGLGLDDLEAVLTRLSRLAELGLNGDMADALATTLGLAGVPEAQRSDVLAKAVALGRAGIALADVQADRDLLQGEVRDLRDARVTLQGALAAGQEELACIQHEHGLLGAGLATLREKTTQLESAIASGQALQGFLESNPDVTDEFFASVVVLREIRRRGVPHGRGIETRLTAAMQQSILAFLKQISMQPLSPPPKSDAQGTVLKES